MTVGDVFYRCTDCEVWGEAIPDHVRCWSCDGDNALILNCAPPRTPNAPPSFPEDDSD